MGSLTCNIRESMNSPAIEAYRVLRTNIQFSNTDSNTKILTVTSFRSGEGKTTTAINTAISMARSGKRTLLVDADMRKPVQIKHLGRNSSLGLSNFISGSTTLDEVINKTNIEGLYFIACGPKPSNPAELLGSAKFTEFLKTVGELFDFVIIDTPPLGSVIDCAIVASKTDGTIIVIKSKTVEYKNAQRAKEQLEKVNARILGVVLNKVKKSDYKYHYSSLKKKGRVPSYVKRYLKEEAPVLDAADTSRNLKV